MSFNQTPQEFELRAAAAAAPMRRPARIAFLYVCAGLLWVILSDRVLALMPVHSNAINRLMFVSVNALLLYLVANRYTAAIRLSTAAREEALARASGYFQSSAEGIITVGSDGLIRQVNPRGQELFGYSEAELRRQPIEKLLPQRFRDRHQAHRSAFFENPHSRWMGRSLEISGVRKDGTEFPAEVNLNVIHTRGGDQVVAFISDTTERRIMEREGRRNETLNALGAVAAGIAHELNNPLAVMGSRIELMLVSGRLSAETRADLLVLQSNIGRASRILHNMLSLARQRPGTRHSLDMNAAVEEAMLIAGAETRGGAMRFETALDLSLPPVFGDVTALQQVLINLVMNACDAGASQVRIETSMAPSSPGHLRLSISDDGSGIEAERLARLFEPFFTTKPGGTGLGLWLSRRIIQDHGGTITAKSEPGKGTEFVVTLPTSDPALTDRKSPLSAIKAPSAKFREARGA